MTAMFVATETGMIDALERKGADNYKMVFMFALLIQKFYTAIVIPPSSPSLKYESPEPYD